MSGDAEIIAALFGKAEQREPDEPPAAEPSTPEPEQPDIAEERIRAAELMLGNPEAAHRLRGETVQELVADAALFATQIENLRRKQQRPPTVEFDGGVRQLAPSPGEPVGDHDALALEIIRQSKQGGGGV